ncbi:lethal (2) k14505 [Carabus blaptoides fortunei]
MCSITLIKTILSRIDTRVLKLSAIRTYATRKRFYRKTGILYSDGRYEITLDQRKLKTPSGKNFSVQSEPLALAVATEWDAQKDKIQQSNMHLTALCSTVIDNPNRLNKLDMVQYLVNYLDTDTVLFQSSENDDLYKFQVQEWDPVIRWFCDRFQVDLEKFRAFDVTSIAPETKAIVERHLLSYNFDAIHGYIFAVDTLKSVILTLACVERVITPEKAVLLSRLEEEFQLSYWGRVEWAHELCQQDLQTRLSAAILFIHFNASSTFTKSKSVT